MADAKYVVGDHRNGDAKIELDANKRQFSGLTKEELMKYADDPFWVNLRWSLFVLFWAAWLCMLAGAIVIIVRAPKCSPPEPKKWYERGPLVDLELDKFEDVESKLPLLQEADVQGIIIDVPTYEVLDQPDLLEQFKAYFAKAKEYGIKLIVQLTPNFVPVTHRWFNQSEYRVEPYTDYFVWRASSEYDKKGLRTTPNKWVSTMNTSAWSLSDTRDEFYLHQYGEGQADLNFRNTDVKAEFDKVIKAWMKAGASGVRLSKARQMLVDPSFADEEQDIGRGSALGAVHTYYAFWQHTRTTDQQDLVPLLAHFAKTLTDSVEPSVAEEAVFTLKEDGGLPELYLKKDNVSSLLHPPASAPLKLGNDSEIAAKSIVKRLGSWPAIQLKSDENNEEIAAFALLLPAAPVFSLQQLQHENNETVVSETLTHLVSLRDDASIAHGDYVVTAVPAVNSTQNSLIACARWKPSHTGYLAVYNLGMHELRANLTSLQSVPGSVTVHHVSHAVKRYTNYTNNHAEHADNVLVPPKSTVVLSYVPKTAVEE